MFKVRYKGIVVVHNEGVGWIGCDRSDAGQCLQHLPLQQILDGDLDVNQIPSKMRGNSKTLCIIPDHWFESSSYPFRSKKRSLIEPYIERKIASTYPDKRSIRYLFNYRNIDTKGDGDGLFSYFLHDNEGLRFYSSMEKMELAPRQITSPGFLWESRLASLIPQFKHAGTLLIHIDRQMCQLYFYFNGYFLFSRDVVLSQESDSMETLTFEINQSLYMFSQKSKTDLEHIFLLTEDAAQKEIISQGLGRDIEDITPKVKESGSLVLEKFPLMNGLLNPGDLVSPPRFFSVTHRRVKQLLDWRPVQWAGAVVGTLLVFALFGESLFLNSLIHRERDESLLIQQSIAKTTGIGLADYETILVDVLNRSEQPTCADTLQRLLNSLSPAVQVKSLGIAVGEQSDLALDAVVYAKGADHFKDVLAHLVAGLRRNFKRAQDFSIRDINIHMDTATPKESAPSYRITFRLDLS